MADSSTAGERTARDVTINIRANRKQRTLIDRAAETLGRNRSDFMLDAACREAEAVLLDRRYFVLDAEKHRRFMGAAGASRPFGVCAGGRVVGYYALATGAESLAAAPGRVRRNMPDPVPVMVLGRLAVDRTYQGRGIGRSLLRDAFLRTLQAAEIAGIRALLVHAVSEDARRLYHLHGFPPSPTA